MYFPLRTAPLDLSADRLRGLRLSLNSPVVSIQELPVGPARAAIAIHEERDGRPNVTVGVQSSRGGAAVLFSFEGDLREHSSLAVGIDAALSFGESMGFLFDEDEFDAGPAEEARPRALRLWLELTGGASEASEAVPGTPRTPASPPVASEPGDAFQIEGLDDVEEELLLDELADPEEELADAFSDELGGADFELPGSESREKQPDSVLSVDALDGIDAAAGRSAETGPEARVSLSKFRHFAPSEPPPDVKRASLGRLRLVKRRKGGGEAPPKQSVILRLLSSF